MTRFADSVLCSAGALAALLLPATGAAQGARLVVDLHPSGSGGPSRMADWHGVTYLMANDGVNGYELWRTDGTAAGTTMVADLRPGPVSSFPDEFTEVGDTLYFIATGPSGNGPYALDGFGGTPRLITPPAGSGYQGSARELVRFDGRLFFTAASTGLERELWATDGSQAGTVRVATIGVTSTSFRPHEMTPSGDRLFFVREDAGSNFALWVTDGSAAGTQLVKAFTGGVTARPLQSLTSIGQGRIVFAADDGDGMEPWVSDGTAAGTTQLRDVEPGAAGSVPTEWTAVGTTVYFAARTGATGNELWRTDGTAAGTAMVADVRPGPADSDPSELCALGARVLFQARDGDGYELFASDGTAAGTQQVKDVRPGFGSSRPHDITATGSRFAYFAADDGSQGEEVWRTDGTEAGTVLVADVSPGRFGSLPGWFALCGTTLLFAAQDGVVGTELWAADVPTSVHPLGYGCGDGVREPQLTATDPVLGGTMTLSGHELPASAVGAVLAGVGDVPFSLLGCRFYLQPATIQTLVPFGTTSGGTFASSLPVPADPALRGLTFAVQAAVAGAVNLETTNGLRLGLGD